MVATSLISTLTADQVTEWSTLHETDPMLACAILSVAETADHAEAIYEGEIHDNEIVAIVEIATRNGIDDAADIAWGDKTLADVLCLD